MGMLANHVDHVIGVDTHRDSHAAAVVAAISGAVTVETTIVANPFAASGCCASRACTPPGRRVWAIESSGSFGAGLTTFLLEQGEWVAEIDRPTRPARRNGAKSDELDAIRAAREALTREHLAQPRQRGRARSGPRAAGHPPRRDRRPDQGDQPSQGARRHIARRATPPAARSARRRARQPLRAPADPAVALGRARATVIALRRTGQRVLALQAEANDLESELQKLVAQTVPALLEETGVGAITAAQLYISWSHPGRLRSDSAFAMLAGSAPIPASSGQIVRYRLNRGGDRQLNCALHTIVLFRLIHDPATRVYASRRATEGKTPREIKRCLKRYVARRLFRILEDSSQPAPAAGSPRARTLGICS